MIWDCFSAAGVGNIDIIEGRMNAEKYKNILEKKPIIKCGITQPNTRLDISTR